MRSTTFTQTISLRNIEVPKIYLCRCIKMCNLTSVSSFKDNMIHITYIVHTSVTTMLRDIKNFNISAEIGAAPDRFKSHRLKPNASRTFTSMILLAILKPKVSGFSTLDKSSKIQDIKRITWILVQVNQTNRLNLPVHSFHIVFQSFVLRPCSKNFLNSFGTTANFRYLCMHGFPYTWDC